MPIFTQMGYQADASDDARIALLKTLEYLNVTYGIVASPFIEGTQALPTDDLRRAAIKINAAIVAGQGGGGGGGGTGGWVKAPSSPTDFSMLPNNQPPTTDQGYLADRDEWTLWAISKSDTEWKVIDKNAV